MKSLKANGRLPRMIVLENVVGLLTINGGEEFKAVIAALDRLGMRAGARRDRRAAFRSPVAAEGVHRRRFEDGQGGGRDRPRTSRIQRGIRIRW